MSDLSLKISTSIQEFVLDKESREKEKNRRKEERRRSKERMVWCTYRDRHRYPCGEEKEMENISFL